MEALRIQTQISPDGILHLELPDEVSGLTCEVIVLYEARPKMSREAWLAFIDETYGSLADNPLEEVRDNLPLEERDAIE